MKHPHLTRGLSLAIGFIFHLSAHASPDGEAAGTGFSLGTPFVDHAVLQQGIEKMESVYGSVYFMPPEQFERKTLDARSDLYSLGCCFYQALAGVHPFRGETVMDVMQAHLDHAVRPISEIRTDIPPWLGDWVMAMIHRNPDDRPPSAHEALVEFEQNDRKTIAASRQVQEAEGKPRLITSSSALATATVSVSTVRETAGIDANITPVRTCLTGCGQSFGQRLVPRRAICRSRGHGTGNGAEKSSSFPPQPMGWIESHPNLIPIS